ncbi:tyrosine-protein kinase receptor Tie-1-like isoform X2 [Acanthaster planci]|uniref:receptor protein-tyrosine kinase n=1 Tax=Acanthaster planci TaxID=133434 RepID=A0A8B8A1E9_ACAPL|nr:tyrosine-protein kinase receptor Tie-1-like isoform X2 [Acanthaster planci]
MYNITMPSSMVSDGDLYAAIHHSLSLNDNHFSLIRLIVRDCVSDKWGPPACVAMCDMCYNGGVCDDETGDCVCPPGFSGPNCLTACGMHRFGWSCEFQCGPGNIIQSCTGSQFGLPDPYGNSCISGYHGRDCNVVCSSGMFGAGCTQTCHCQSGMCDAYTGVCTTQCSSGICSSSACTQGWLGSNCQIPDECPAGYYGEQCLSKCNCFNAAACDRISGYCSGGCASGFTCVTSPCSSSPCQHGGTCSVQGSTFSCNCQYPYSGSTCEIFIPCSTSPCQHGGTCSAQGSTFSCTCPPDYTGNNCEAFIFQIACSTGMTVVGTPGMTISVEIPQPFVSSGFSNVHFTYMGPQGIIATPTNYQVPVPLTGSTSVNIGVMARGLFNIIQRSCQIPVTVTGFQMMCTPNITVLGHPGSDVSVAIPEPMVSGGVEGVTFAYVVESASIPTPSSYEVAVPDNGSTTVMVNVIPLVSFSSGMSCNISVIIKGLPYLSQTPSVTLESRLATLTWQAWNTSSGDRGAGPVTAYKVYYSLTSPISWIAGGTISVTDPFQSTYSFTVQPLEPSTEYMFSVAAVGDGTGEGSRSPSFSGLTIPLPSTSTDSSLPIDSTMTEVRTVLHSTPASSSNTAAIAAVVVVVLVMATVAVGLIIFYLHRHRRNRKGESSAQSAGEREMSAYQNKIASDIETISSAYEKVDHVRPSSSSYEIVGLGSSSSSTYEDVSLPSWAHQWGIPWQNVIVGEKVLDSGNFGEVLDGVVIIEGEFSKAAIKTLRTNASPHDRQLFMEEFRTLTKLGSHPNIVNLLGACQHEDNLYVTLEYLPNGDLRSYLRNARTQGDSGQTSLSSEKLIQFALDVAEGMQHLAALGVIHRDLAARNILLSDDLVAKVSDFGLSRGEDIYVQTSKTRVPTRWLSLESLLRQVYTSKSDVWSFGILLWEIATLGATPYEDTKSKDLPSRLENGYRMLKPSNCDDEIYSLMTQCWQEDPKERPAFKKLTSILKTMAENQIEKTYMRLLPKSEDYMHLIFRPALDDN